MWANSKLSFEVISESQHLQEIEWTLVLFDLKTKGKSSC